MASDLARHGRRGDRAALAAASLLLVLHSLSYLAWTEDDAGVSLRYAANLVEGQGLVYNPGERVEAISNLGLVLLLAPIYALLPGPDARLHLLLAAKLLGLVAATLGLFEARRLARISGLGRLATFAALVLVAGSGPYAAWAVGGLEVPFVAWASAALVAAAAEIAAGASSPGPGPVRRAQLAALALVLLRVDGFVLPAAILATLWLLRRPLALVLRLAAPAAALLVLVFLGRLLYYGEWWPNPVLAKVELATSGPAALHTGATYLRPFLLLHGGWALALGAIVVAGLGTGPATRARRLAGAAVLALAAYNLLIGADWMPLYRFLVPATIPLVVTVAAAGERLATALARRASAVTVVALVLALAGGEALAGRAAFKRRRAVPFWWFHPTLSPRSLVAFWWPAVEWLERSLPADALLLTSEAGFIPYLSGLRTVDSFGLASREIARLPRRSVERSTLGVHTRFVAAPPADPAQRLVAALPAAAVVLQTHMVALWNDGEVPPALFAGRFRLVAGSPAGAAWAIYRPAGDPGPGSR